MTFPVIESVTDTEAPSGSESTSHVGDYPATVNAGDLLIVVASFGWGDGTVTEPTGYDGTIKFTTANGSSNKLSGFVKLAAGTEGGGTYTVTTGESSQGLLRCIRVSGWYGTISGGVEFGTASTGSDDSPDAPSLTPAWGSADTLWLDIFGNDNPYNTVSSYPTNYTAAGTYAVTSSNGSPSGIGSSYRNYAAASENPGVVTLDGSIAWVANTIAVRPAAASPVGFIMLASGDGGFL